MQYYVYIHMLAYILGKLLEIYEHFSEELLNCPIYFK